MDALDMLPDGTARSGNEQYDALPRAVKDSHSYQQWLWLSDLEKHNLVQSETEPEF